MTVEYELVSYKVKQKKEQKNDIRTTKKRILRFIIYVYKDMELADEIEYCMSYADYEQAKGEYKKRKRKRKWKIFCRTYRKNRN